MSDLFPLGIRGETWAWNFLKKRGYSILEKNFRTRLGEIDFVAEKDGVIIFVEVKTRRTLLFGPPEEAVDGRKRKKLIQVAEAFLQARGLENRPARFDFLSILWKGRGEPEFSLLEDAFGPGD